MYNHEMIEELADLLTEAAAETRGRGLRVNVPWLAAALDGDERLARATLRAAGYRPESETWREGKGRANLGDFSYPAALSDRLTDVLNHYDPV